MKYKFKDFMPSIKKIKLTYIIIFATLCMCIFMVPIITFLSPGVAEATNPALGECDIYYNGEYYECMTLQEAFILNTKIAAVIFIISSIFLQFLPIKILKENAYEKY